MNADMIINMEFLSLLCMYNDSCHSSSSSVLHGALCIWVWHAHGLWGTVDPHNIRDIVLLRVHHAASCGHYLHLL